MKVKVYVAAKFEDAPMAKETMNLLEKEGFEITHDWTKEFFEKPEVTDELLSKCAVADADGVIGAHVLVIYPHPQGKGQYTELGITIALNRPVIAIGDASNVFLRHPLVMRVDTTAEALKILHMYSWATRNRYHGTI